MPRYNGAFSYVLGVFAHVVRSYFVFLFFYPMLALPFFLVAAVSGDGAESLRGFGSLFAEGWVFLLGCIHGAVFLLFRSYFVPRFPYAPALLTFVLAATFGSALIAAVWALGQSDWQAATSFALALAISAGAGVLGLFIYAIGGAGQYTWGAGRWLGWLLVGREAYDDYVTREQDRMRQEYQAHREKIRGP